jgi:hypothetical protein
MVRAVEECPQRPRSAHHVEHAPRARPRSSSRALTNAFSKHAFARRGWAPGRGGSWGAEAAVDDHEPGHRRDKAHLSFQVGAAIRTIQATAIEMGEARGGLRVHGAVAAPHRALSDGPLRFSGRVPVRRHDERRTWPPTVLHPSTGDPSRLRTEAQAAAVSQQGVRERDEILSRPRSGPQGATTKGFKRAMRG